MYEYKVIPNTDADAYALVVEYDDGKVTHKLPIVAWAIMTDDDEIFARPILPFDVGGKKIVVMRGLWITELGLIFDNEKSAVAEATGAMDDDLKEIDDDDKPIMSKGGWDRTIKRLVQSGKVVRGRDHKYRPKKEGQGHEDGSNG
jgi:hypothetical protein